MTERDNKSGTRTHASRRHVHRNANCGCFDQAGLPVESYRPTHNQNHHQFTQLETDHLCTEQMQYSWHLLNLLLFFPHVSTHARRPALHSGRAR